jgi:hypothetical protein
MTLWGGGTSTCPMRSTVIFDKRARVAILLMLRADQFDGPGLN